MSEKYVMVGNVKVMQGSRTYDLLTSGKAEDKKIAKRLIEFCNRAEAIGYKLEEYTELRKEYKDIL